MSPILRLNTVSKAYTGNQSFPADSSRGYFFIVMTSAAGTVEFGEGGGLIPLANGQFYEPFVCPISQIDVVTTGTFVVHSA